MRLVAYLCCVAFVVSGCAGFRHGATLAQYQHQMLPMSSRPGAERLQIEMDFDPAVRTAVETYGNPTYLFVESGSRVYLMWVDEERLVTVERGFSANGTPTVSPAIPDQFSSQFLTADRDRLSASRARASSARAESSIPLTTHVITPVPTEFPEAKERSTSSPSPGPLVAIPPAAEKFPVVDDPFRAFIEYQAPTIHSGSALWSMVALRDRKSRLITYQLIFGEVYNDEWRFYSSVSLLGGKTISARPVTRDVGSCSKYSGCTHTELIAADLPRDALNGALTIKVNGKLHTQIIEFPAEYVQSFVKFVESK